MSVRVTCRVWCLCYAHYDICVISICPLADLHPSQLKPSPRCPRHLLSMLTLSRHNPKTLVGAALLPRRGRG
jgi:hypothetical protein